MTVTTTHVAVADLFNQPFRLGMEGDPVRRFQEGLDKFVPVEASGAYDEKTAAAVSKFQQQNALKPTGEVNPTTFGVLWNKTFWETGHPLDLNPGLSQQLGKHLELHAYRDQHRVDVINTDSGTVVRSYPISAGSSTYPTPAIHAGSIKQVTEKPWWHPPDSPWAHGAKPVEPGPSNPMGPVKLNLKDDIYFHGVPRKEWDSIGHASQSHGCMRMFPQDAWELHGLVGPGTKVEVQ
jgi:murein L,D-transpeptidase YcbB/YkuD